MSIVDDVLVPEFWGDPGEEDGRGGVGGVGVMYSRGKRSDVTAYTAPKQSTAVRFAVHDTASFNDVQHSKSPTRTSSHHRHSASARGSSPSRSRPKRHPLPSALKSGSKQHRPKPRPKSATFSGRSNNNTNTNTNTSRPVVGSAAHHTRGGSDLSASLRRRQQLHPQPGQHSLLSTCRVRRPKSASLSRSASMPSTTIVAVSSRPAPTSSSTAAAGSSLPAPAYSSSPPVSARIDPPLQPSRRSSHSVPADTPAADRGGGGGGGSASSSLTHTRRRRPQSASAGGRRNPLPSAPGRQLSLVEMARRVRHGMTKPAKQPWIGVATRSKSTSTLAANPLGPRYGIKSRAQLVAEAVPRAHPLRKSSRPLTRPTDLVLSTDRRLGQRHYSTIAQIHKPDDSNMRLKYDTPTPTARTRGSMPVRRLLPYAATASAAAAEGAE